MYVCKCCGKEVNTGQDNREPFSAHAENKGSYPKWRLRDYIALAALSLFLYVAWFLCPLGFPQIYYFLTEMLENFVERLGDLLIAR